MSKNTKHRRYEKCDSSTAIPRPKKIIAITSIFKNFGLVRQIQINLSLGFSDIIKNVTNEFKTKLSTISIAVIWISVDTFVASLALIKAKKNAIEVTVQEECTQNSNEPILSLLMFIHKI